MPIYTYKGFNRKGKEVTDIIDAPNPDAARSRLKGQGIFVKSLKEDSQKKDRELFPFLAKLRYRIPRKEVGVLARQLGTLLGAGVSLDKSLRDLSEQLANVHLKKIVIDIREKVTEGMTLSEALAEHPTVFPPVYSSLISVGEKTGSYESALMDLAEMEDFNLEIRQKVQVAMIYPFIMGSISILVTVFLLAVVVPSIQELFASFKDVKLPVITRFVVGLSHLMVNFWWLLLIMFIGAVAAFVRYRSTEKGRRETDRLLARVPLIGPLLTKMVISRFTKNMASLLSNKVPLLISLDIMRDLVGNAILSDELKEAGDRIREGDSLSRALLESKVLSPMVLGMIAAGEASDQVPELLKKAGGIYEKEVETAIKTLTNSLEPLMIVGIGGIIMVIMMAIMLPMYELVNQINF